MVCFVTIYNTIRKFIVPFGSYNFKAIRNLIRLE